MPDLQGGQNWKSPITNMLGSETPFLKCSVPNLTLIEKNTMNIQYEAGLFHRM